MTPALRATSGESLSESSALAPRLALDVVAPLSRSRNPSVSGCSETRAAGPGDAAVSPGGPGRWGLPGPEVGGVGLKPPLALLDLLGLGLLPAPNTSCRQRMPESSGAGTQRVQHGSAFSCDPHQHPGHAMGSGGTGRPSAIVGLTMFVRLAYLLASDPVKVEVAVCQLLGDVDTDVNPKACRAKYNGVSKARDATSSVRGVARSVLLEVRARRRWIGVRRGAGQHHARFKLLACQPPI